MTKDYSNKRRPTSLFVHYNYTANGHIQNNFYFCNILLLGVPRGSYAYKLVVKIFLQKPSPLLHHFDTQHFGFKNYMSQNCIQVIMIYYIQYIRVENSQIII